MPPIRSSYIDAEESISELSTMSTSSDSSPALWGSREASPSSASSYDIDDDASHSGDDYQPTSTKTNARRKPAYNYVQIPPKRRIKSQLGSTPSTNPARNPAVKSVTIKGKKLYPTVVFDTFWYFSAERKAIDDRRREGLPPPWTEDHILQGYFFCNTFRVLDKVTQYIIKEVIGKGPQSQTEVVFRVVLFNMFTKIETWELLQEKLGPLTWETYDRYKYKAVLDQAKKQGMTLYTGAFIKPAPNFERKEEKEEKGKKEKKFENHVNHLILLEVFMENDLPQRLSEVAYMDELYEFLVSFPSMGEFLTYQLILNLSYTPFLNFSGLDFVVAGPGAISGLKKMFGESFVQARRDIPGFEVDVMRWLAQHQQEHFERLGLDFSGLGPDHLPMELPDIEHTLCEVDKYSRLAHPQFKGRRTEMRRAYEPPRREVPEQVVLPRAWSHPNRKIVKIRPGGPPVVEKRYTISRLGGHRQGVAGREYHVFWEGYSDSESTWEPEDGLLQDAPRIVQEYKAKHRLV
ncbi:hypothetical protein AX16_009319 [Volvariella volvacea WC 439]|nr:hypothetical protein AX16_009319 [Volvariella volvacea WC 439]